MRGHLDLHKPTPEVFHTPPNSQLSENSLVMILSAYAMIDKMLK